MQFIAFCLKEQLREIGNIVVWLGIHVHPLSNDLTSVLTRAGHVLTQRHRKMTAYGDVVDNICHAASSHIHRHVTLGQNVFYTYVVWCINITVSCYTDDVDKHSYKQTKSKHEWEQFNVFIVLRCNDT